MSHLRPPIICPKLRPVGGTATFTKWLRMETQLLEVSCGQNRSGCGPAYAIERMTADFQKVTKRNAGALLTFMRELYDHENLPWRERPTTAAVDQLLSNRKYGGAWFLNAKGERVGYMVLASAFSLEFGGKFVFLDELYIREPWTGKGLGTAALRFARQQARKIGARAIRLEVGHDNPRGVRFYESHGMRREQRYLMTKRLG